MIVSSASIAVQIRRSAQVPSDFSWAIFRPTAIVLKKEIICFLFSKRKLFGRDVKTTTILSRHVAVTAHEEGRPFDDPPLPRCTRKVPEPGHPIGTLKPRSCSNQIGSVRVDGNH
jgi:hypothetical protein